MDIEEAVKTALQMPEGSVLAAKPPLTYGADAKFVMLTEDYRFPQWAVDEGFQYILGRDDILYLLKFLRSKAISDKAAAEFIIHYGINDCQPAWIEDIPNR